MKLLIVSDSHGNARALEEVLCREADADFILHLGDGLSDLTEARRTMRCPQDYPVRGNCDYDRSIPSERLCGFGGKLIFLTHGNGYEVKMTTSALLATAKQRGADIALFGHTHLAYYAYTDGIYLFNPGALSMPQAGRPSYGVLTLNSGCEPEFAHKRL
ncbi:MAG: metallophosphoesterase [Pygmaiobacter sp.]